MYKININGVFKVIETWNIFIPLHDNEGVPFGKKFIESTLEDISLNFPGFTIVNCIGYWKDLNQIYTDENLQLIIDIFPFKQGDSTLYFTQLKDNLKKKFDQEKVYITKTNNKEEFISFDEFINEFGIENPSFNDKNQKRELVEQLINRQDFILQRLSYNTISLKRNKERNKIIWERKICGIKIISEFDDNLPIDIKIIPADKIDELGRAITNSKSFAVIGHYELQNYILEKIKFHPLINVNLNDELANQLIFTDQEGNAISVKNFIEYFTMTIFNNYLVLKDEGFRRDEISINVGHDGSFQIGKSQIGKIILLSQAIIPQKEIILEIIRCIDEVIELFEKNELDHIPILQSKARNHYLFKRAFVRRNLGKN